MVFLAYGKQKKRRAVQQVEKGSCCRSQGEDGTACLAAMGIDWA